jgi:hypothetical protein
MCSSCRPLYSATNPLTVAPRHRPPRRVLRRNPPGPRRPAGKASTPARRAGSGRASLEIGRKLERWDFLKNMDYLRRNETETARAAHDQAPAAARLSGPDARLIQLGGRQMPGKHTPIFRMNIAHQRCHAMVQIGRITAKESRLRSPKVRERAENLPEHGGHRSEVFTEFKWEGASGGAGLPPMRQCERVLPGLAPPGEPDPAETAGRYGAETTVPDWRERLVCDQPHPGCRRISEGYWRSRLRFHSCRWRFLAASVHGSRNGLR